RSTQSQSELSDEWPRGDRREYQGPERLSQFCHSLHVLGHLLLRESYAGYQSLECSLRRFRENLRAGRHDSAPDQARQPRNNLVISTVSRIPSRLVLESPQRRNEPFRNTGRKSECFAIDNQRSRQAELHQRPAGYGCLSAEAARARLGALPPMNIKARSKYLLDSFKLLLVDWMKLW